MENPTKCGIGSVELEEAIHEFMQIDRLHRKVFECLVASSGIHPAQHRALVWLTRSEDVRTQKDLAEHFAVSPAAVASMLKKMEAAGVIARTSAPQDCRQKEIQVTEKGRAIVERTGKQFVRTDVAMLDGFSPEELETLRGYFSRMRENLLRSEQSSAEASAIQKEDKKL